MGPRQLSVGSRWTTTNTLIAGSMAGLGIAAMLRQGAFFPYMAGAVAGVAGLLALTRLTRRPRPSAREVAVYVAAVLLAAWWLARALGTGRAESFLPLGAGIIAFAAAFAVVRGIPYPERRPAAVAFVAVGSLSGLGGLLAVIFQWYPVAISSQGLWRLATTLTYSNAAGALLAMSLLMALALDAEKVLVRVALTVCMAALLATQSRGAVLATAIAIFLVPWAQVRRGARPLGLGVLAGLATVAVSPGSSPNPLALVVLLACLAAAAALKPGSEVGGVPMGRKVLIGVAVVAVALVAAATVLHAPIERRLQLGSTQDRGVEWSAAYAQFTSSPLIGTGPDQILHFVAPDGNVAHFAHNEYLQILAGGGLVGEVLLLGLVVAVIRAVTRHDVLAACATAALLSFALSGALDFDWHLPALCLWAGWAGGLAGPADPLTVPAPSG
jgi:hypothetical protein